MEDSVRQWVTFSDDDFEMAHAALERSKWNWAVVCCQQAVEKRLKALIAATGVEIPPKLHNLPLLAAEAGVECDEATVHLLGDLTRGYITGRYPPVPGGELFQADADAAAEVVDRTSEVMAWLDQLLMPNDSPDEP